MQRLGQLLAHSSLGSENQATIRAATIVATATKIILKDLQLRPDEARAATYRNKQITVHVSHGAVGGQINIHQNRLLVVINQALERIYPGNTQLVQRINVRQA